MVKKFSNVRFNRQIGEYPKEEALREASALTGWLRRNGLHREYEISVVSNNYNKLWRIFWGTK